jgi:hypothetical protein
MAGIRFRASSGEEGLGAGAAETVLQVVAATNHRVKITEYGITFKGTSATDTPVRCRIFRQTGAGTSQAGTISKDDASVDETLQTAVRNQFTAEPTSDDVLIDEFEVHPQTGIKAFLPLNQEILIPGGGRLGFKLTAAQAQTAVVSVAGEE